jgi:hypothetical protein
MDSLKSILDDYDFSTPPEVDAIKRYIKKEFNMTPRITMQAQSIIISVHSASLANTLRLRSPDLKRRCQIDKRLVFRIE